MANKLDDLLEVRRDMSVDVMFLVETWHDTDSVAFQRLRADGFEVVDRPRPRSRTDTLATNHGGLAAVASPGIRLSSLDLGIKPASFELLPVRVVSGSSACVVVVVYRTGPVTTTFFAELSDVMDRCHTRRASLRRRRSEHPFRSSRRPFISPADRLAVVVRSVLARLCADI